MTTGVNLAIKAALLSRRLNQYDLAHAIGCTETRVSRIVCGRAEATDYEKKKIAEMLKLSVAELFDSPAEGQRQRKVGRDG